MYAEERQQRIATQARADGRVEVTTLAADFDVTTETIRRDLSALERRGVLRRVHGGAIPVERLTFEPEFAARESSMTAEKERIAKAAQAEVPEQGAILVDAGTTTARFAEALPIDRELTVVTNALPVAMILAGRPNLTLLTIGGRVRSRTLAAVDAWALATLAEIHVDVAFVGTNGISVERGLTTPDPAESAVKKAMINCARHVVVLADHTKFEQDHLARFGELRQVGVVIADNGLDRTTAEEIAAEGPRVVRA